MFQQFWKIFESAEIERDLLRQEQKNKRSLKKEEIRKTVLSKDAFKQHDDLSSKVWNEDGHLKLEVKLKLKRIANAFLRDHNVDPDAVEDIYFTGSLAGYNYHPDSDIDLHIVVDFSKVNQDIDLVRDLFNSRRLVWNEQHNITIFGHEVEIYIEDVDEVYDDEDRPVYSITKDQWIKKPRKEDRDFDYDSAMKKAHLIMHQIGLVRELMSQEKFVEAKRQAVRIFAKLKRMRKAGLQREGAYSPENIAFKILRKQGYIDQLAQYRSDSHDLMMSLPQ